LNYIESVLKAMGIEERRKARNILVRPGMQLRLPLYVLLLSFTFMLLGLLLGNLYFEQTYVTLMQHTTQSDYLQRVITQQTGEFKLLALLLLGIYVLLVFIITTIFTHRLIGPTIPMVRHVEALRKGRYGHRIKLRRHDAFAELADALNELAETLQNGERPQ